MRILLAAALTLGLASMANANIWIDESFDDGSPWTQGAGPDTGATGVDVFSNDALTSQLSSVLTQTGSVLGTKNFNGTSCYRMQPGQTIAVGEPYMNQQNGNMCYLQYAVNVDPIPAAGDVGSVVWNVQRNVDANVLVWSFTVKLVSTGSAVNIMAGETTGTLAQIGTLSSVNDWKFVTMRLHYGDGTTADPRPVIIPSEQSKTPGMYFYCSGTTPALTVPITGAVGLNSKKVRTLAFTCASGAFNIDALYYDGGLEASDVIAHSRLRAFDYAGSSGINDWALFE
jgi:hypothetical protein